MGRIFVFLPFSVLSVSSVANRFLEHNMKAVLCKKYGPPEEWIRILNKRIVQVHLKDFKKKGEKWVNLRDGDVNWPEVRKAFREIGYTGYVTPELAGGDEKYLRDLSQRIDLIEAGK